MIGIKLNSDSFLLAASWATFPELIWSVMPQKKFDNRRKRKTIPFERKNNARFVNTGNDDDYRSVRMQKKIRTASRHVARQQKVALKVNWMIVFRGKGIVHLILTFIYSSGPPWRLRMRTKQVGRKNGRWKSIVELDLQQNSARSSVTVILNDSKNSIKD